MDESELLKMQMDKLTTTTSWLIKVPVGLPPEQKQSLGTSHQIKPPSRPIDQGYTFSKADIEAGCQLFSNKPVVVESSTPLRGDCGNNVL